jgi:hypothetical protein
MSVATEKARIALICETLITGVNEGYAGMPRDIAGANLPAVVVLTGEAARDRKDDMLQTARVYRLALLVKSWAEGIELEAEALCEPFFDRFETVFHARPSLQTTDNTTTLAGVLDAYLGADTGVTNIELAGVGFSGVIFDLTVISLREIARMH